MKDIRRIAWSIFWKFGLCGTIAGYASGFVFGLIVGFIGTMAGYPQESFRLLIQIGGTVCGLAASFMTFNFFLARAIGRRVGDRRLELVDATASGER